MALAETFSFSISVLVLALGVVLCIALLLHIIMKIKLLNEPKYYAILKNVLKQNSLLLIFIISMIATMGSLFYSEIIGYAPCKLCWFQRIFMYPIPLLAGIALIKKDQTIKKYILFLAIIGAIFSIYHYSIQFLPQLVACTIDGANCAEKQSFYFGYITIPMMALTAFITITLLSSTKNKTNQNKNKKIEK